MPGIYISYRKEDTPGQAARLFMNLSEAFGPGTVFMDVARSEPGRDVRQAVDEHLAGSAVVLVVIGTAWADAIDKSGQRRLDSPQDLVRVETAAALKRDLPVIPVLVQDAAMPRPGDLPPDLADLAFRNPVTLGQSQWGTDVEMLITLLHSLVHGQVQSADVAGVTSPAATPQADAPPGAAVRTRGAQVQPRERAPWRVAVVAAAVVVVAGGLGVYAFMSARQASPDRTVVPTQEAAAAAVAKADATEAEAEARAAPTPTLKDPTERAAPRAESPKSVASAAEQAPPPITATAKPQPAPAGAATQPDRVLSVQKWTLNSGGCGAGPVSVIGTATFSIAKTSDAIVVTEEFRGSGSGFDVVVTGQVEFSHEQPSYDIPTSGQWTGAKVFKTAGIDRVNTSDGTTPRSASVVKFQSLCG